MTFQMQSHHDGVWTPMEDGPGKSVWRPRRTAWDAAVKCLTWTGLISIPAMQVVDLDTGVVVWRDASYYPEAGESVRPEWDATARRAAHQELVGDLEEAEAATTAEQLAFDFGGIS